MSLIFLDNETFPLQSVKAVKLNDVWYSPVGMPRGVIESGNLVWLNSDLVWDRETGSYADYSNQDFPTDIQLWPNPGPFDAPETPFKYDEGRLLEEFDQYVRKTYTQHYVGENNVQSLDLIFATGHGEGFCTGNVLKYGARHGKKAGQQRADLLKVMHYAMLMLHLVDKEEAKNNVR